MKISVTFLTWKFQNIFNSVSNEFEIFESGFFKKSIELNKYVYCPGVTIYSFRKWMLIINLFFTVLFHVRISIIFLICFPLKNKTYIVPRVNFNEHSVTMSSKYEKKGVSIITQWVAKIIFSSLMSCRWIINIRTKKRVSCRSFCAFVFIKSARNPLNHKITILWECHFKKIIRINQYQ